MTSLYTPKAHIQIDRERWKMPKMQIEKMRLTQLEIKFCSLNVFTFCNFLISMFLKIRKIVVKKHRDTIRIISESLI